MSKSKVFTVTIDERMDNTLNELKNKLGKTSRAEVFRLGIAVLKLVEEGKRSGLKLTLSDEKNKVLKEILLPA